MEVKVGVKVLRVCVVVQEFLYAFRKDFRSEYVYYWD